MKHTFILDENVVKAALKCSQVANQLLYRIANNSHSLAVHTTLYGSYWAILKKHVSSSHHPYIQPVIGGILLDARRCKFLPGPFVDENTVRIRHRKDVFLAQIAYALDCEAIIVTMDFKTREDLVAMRLKALSLKPALEYAADLDP